MLLALLLACGPEPDAEPASEWLTWDDTEATTDSFPPADSEPVVDTGPPPTITEESIGDQVLTDDWVYSRETLHQVDLEIPHDSWIALGEAPYEWAVADVVVDGIPLNQVAVRLRGALGSYRTLSGKPKFRVDFNQYVDNQRLYGLETINLNNNIVDCSFLKEAVAAAVFEAAGVPASRMTPTQVSVNGEDYGVYGLLEAQNENFLDRYWDDGSGNLYDGKYWYNGSTYVLLDFGTDADHFFQLEEGTAGDHSDITTISDAVASSGTAQFYADTDAVVDWPAIQRNWVAEHWVGQLDGYVMNRNNYRVYFDPADGKAELIPWDLDYAFFADGSWGRYWTSPYGVLAAGCYGHSGCREDWRSVAEDTLDDIDAVDIEGILDNLLDLTNSAVYADPRTECAAGSISSYRAGLESWVPTRSDALRAHWGL